MPLEKLAPELKNLRQKEACCPKHGPYQAASFNGEDWSGCQACRAETESADKVSRQKASASAAWENRLKAAGIPKRFRRDRISLGGFMAQTAPQREALKIAAEYAADLQAALESGRSLIFSGRPGTGKTHLSVAILKEACRLNYNCQMVTVSDFMRRVKASWNDKAGETEAAVLAFYVKPDFLVLEEVGKQYGSTAEEVALFSLIDKRYLEERPTIITTNEEEDGIKHYLGEAVFDRLKEGGGLLVPFDWGSLRGKVNPVSSESTPAEKMN